MRVAVLAAIGAPEVCLEWSSSQALAAGATEDEITGVPLAIAPVIGLGQMVGAAPASRARSGTTSRPHWRTPWYLMAPLARRVGPLAGRASHRAAGGLA